MVNDFKKWVYKRMALNNMTAGRPAKAERWYKRLEIIEPESIEVLHNLGVVSIALKKFRDAEFYLRRVIEIYGESPVRLRILGDLYYQEGSMEKAGKTYGKALAGLQRMNTDRSTENFLRKRIGICNDRSLSAKAVESGRLMDSGPDLLSDGKFTEALTLFLKAAEYDRSSYMALNSAGTILLNNIQDYMKARDCFRKALDLAEIPLIKQNLALAEYKIRETGGA